MNTPEIIKKIDWTDLRTQKTLLLQTINNEAVSPEHKEGLEGILALIDALQDYAVDVMDVDPMHVFDFEEEDVRDGYTGIEPTMSEEKISVQELLAFVNNEDNHTEGELGNSCIDVQTIVNHFTKPQPNKKMVFSCTNCNSDSVEIKKWVNPNTDEISDSCDEEDVWCNDCETNKGIYVRPNAKIIGYQVVGGEDCGLHPDMDASFCVYSLSQAREMIENFDGEEHWYWRLLTIYEGDIEEPTIMFEGNPRD